MGVYINMEMPKSCYSCPLRRRDGMDIVCPVAHERFSVADVNILDYRLASCPLVPVPPHGRLIDADALKSIVFEALNDAITDGNSTPFGKTLCAFIANNIIDEIDNAPTIIPAIIPAEEEKNDKQRSV